MAYGAAPTRDLVGSSPHMYVKLNLHCAAAANEVDTTNTVPAGAGNLCVLDVTTVDTPSTSFTAMQAIAVESKIRGQFLMRANYDAGAGGHSDWTGNCLHYKQSGTDPDFGVGDTATHSIGLVRHATDDTVKVYFGTVGCQGMATTATGFQFGAAPTQGKFSEGGEYAAAISTILNMGIEKLTTAAADTGKVIMTATRWTSKKNFAFQLSGPYATAACTELALGNSTINYPFVAALEDAAREASPTTFTTTDVYQNENGISATTKNCWNYNNMSLTNGVATGEGDLFEVSLGSGAGEFNVVYTTGGSASRAADTGACAAGSTYHKMTYKMTYAGIMSTTGGQCVQAINAADALVNAVYYKLSPASDQIGAWPASEDLPSAADCPGASPASGLHFSAVVGTLIAIINMLM